MRDILQTMGSDRRHRPQAPLYDPRSAPPPTRLTDARSKDAAFERTLEIKKENLFLPRDNCCCSGAAILDAVNPSPTCHVSEERQRLVYRELAPDLAALKTRPALFLVNRFRRPLAVGIRGAALARFLRSFIQVFPLSSICMFSPLCNGRLGESGCCPDNASVSLSVALICNCSLLLSNHLSNHRLSKLERLFSDTFPFTEPRLSVSLLPLVQPNISWEGGGGVLKFCLTKYLHACTAEVETEGLVLK